MAKKKLKKDAKAKDIKRRMLDNERLEKQEKRRKLDTESIPGFPKYVDKLENLDTKYLMLVGGSSEDVSTCIECIERLGFKKTVNVACRGRDDDALKQEIYNKLSTYKYPTEEQVQRLIAEDPEGEKEILEKTNTDKQVQGIWMSTATIKHGIREKRRGKRMTRNHNLCILNNISSVNKDVWLELANDINNSTPRLPFLIVTVKSKENMLTDEELDSWRALFEIISLGKTVESKEQPGEDIEQDDEDALPHLHGNIFRWEEGVKDIKRGRWEIAFGGKTSFLADKEGFHYISYVLSNSQRNFHNYYIYKMVKELKPGSVTVDQQYEVGLYLESSTEIKTSEKDKSKDYKEYQEMLAALDKYDRELKGEKSKLEIDNRNPSRVAEIDAQLIDNMEIRKTIAEDCKPGGKQEIANAKTVSNVHRSIYRSLEIIKRENLILWRHLDEFFQNGKEFTSYWPYPIPLWQTDYSEAKKKLKKDP